MSDEMPEWAAEVVHNQRYLIEQFTHITTMLEKITEQVQPVITQVASHPMLKMMGVKIK